MMPRRPLFFLSLLALSTGCTVVSGLGDLSVGARDAGTSVDVAPLEDQSTVSDDGPRPTDTSEVDVGASDVPATPDVPTMTDDVAIDTGNLIDTGVDTGGDVAVMDAPDVGVDTGNVVDTGNDTGSINDAGDVVRIDTGCATGLTVCNGTCVSTPSSPQHCGQCGNACAVPNAAPACSEGVCTISLCNNGFENCDGNGANGCETALDTNAANCGGCGVLCSRPNANTTCTGGACALLGCAAGFQNCDSNPGNGCEVDVRANPANCGACGAACGNVANATRTCANGTCTMVCNAGFANCDGNVANGCEANITSSNMHCGGCNMPCSGGNSCANSMCVRQCPGGRSCNGVCVDPNTDVDHCGTCGNVCPVVANGRRICVSGACNVACDAGYTACLSGGRWVCVDLVIDRNHCRACNNACASNQVCKETCQLCAAPNTICGNDCPNLASDSTHCGACNNACPAGAICSAGRCVMCTLGQTACNGSCVYLSSDPRNCGRCGNVCQRGVCVAGFCRGS